MKRKCCVFNSIVHGENINLEIINGEGPSINEAADEVTANGSNNRKGNNNHYKNNNKNNKGENSNYKSNNRNGKVNERAETVNAPNSLSKFFSFSGITESSSQKIQFSEEEQKYTRQRVKRDGLDEES